MGIFDVYTHHSFQRGFLESSLPWSPTLLSLFDPPSQRVMQLVPTKAWVSCAYNEVLRSIKCNVFVTVSVFSDC